MAVAIVFPSADIIAAQGAAPGSNPSGLRASSAPQDGSETPVQATCTTEPGRSGIVNVTFKNVSADAIKVVHFQILDAGAVRAMSAYTGSAAPNVTTTYAISGRQIEPIGDLACAVVYVEFQDGSSWSVSTTDSAVNVPEIDAPQISQSQSSRPLSSAPATRLQKICPATSTIALLTVRAGEARAVMAFEEERDVNRKIALVYFRCAAMTENATTLTGKYIHDKATLLYAQTIEGTLGSVPDPEGLLQLSQVVQKLVAATGFRDVRDGAIALAADLPAPAARAPTVVPLDPRACRASGFEKDIDGWLSAYNDYVQDTQNTNLMGNQKATLLSGLGYGVSRVTEAAALQKLSSIGSSLLQDMLAIERANAPETSKAVEVVLNALNQTNSYAMAFTNEAHRGASGLVDADHVKESRLSVDDALMKLQQVPYCER